MALKASQMGLIETLISSAPDAAINRLAQALASEGGGDGPMATIRDMVSAEASERRARRLAFGPLAPLCQSSSPASAPDAFPAGTLKALWKALKAAAPDQVSLAVAATLQWSDEDETSPAFNNLCSAASSGLSSPAGTPFESAAGMLEDACPGGAAKFANHLDLVPLAREAITRLPEWVGRMTEERAAAVRLAYRDATAIAPDAGPRFLEILAGQLEDPSQILRLVSAIEDKPSDGFLDGSELGDIGRRLLDCIDRKVELLSAFEPAAGAAAGKAAADALTQAVGAIAEFEHNLNLKKDGPWGMRIFRQKALLAKKVELLLKKVDDTVGAALPLKPSKAGRSARGMPNLSQPPDPLMVARAETMLTFIERSRAASQAGGYASLRAKVIERLDDRLDHYVDDVLENLRGEAPEAPEIAAEFLEIAARFIGLFRDEKAAQIVRRRAAA